MIALAPYLARRKEVVRTAGVLGLFCLAFAACADKVVDLTPKEDQPGLGSDGGGDDMNSMPQPPVDDDVECKFERDAKQFCALCYKRKELVEFSCTEAEPAPPPDAGSEPEPPMRECFIRQDQRRCLFCPTGDGSFAVKGCVECKDPDPMSMCQLCWWSDQNPEKELCRACEGSNGVSYATCDKLRSEPIMQMMPMR